MSIERLSIGPSSNYSAIECSIHVGRYAPVLKLCRGKRVLDIACGEGYGSWLLSQAGAEAVLGLDISADAVSEAKRLFQAPNLTFDTCDAEQVADKLQGCAFDTIVCIETIEHVRNPRSFLGQLRRLAEKDCVIMITCPNDHWYYSSGQSNPFHIRKYTFREYQELTMGELGQNVRWFAGTAAQGFVAAPLKTDGEARSEYGQGAPSKYVAVEQMAVSVLCPPEEASTVDTATCGYFLGIWNPPDTALSGGAIFPMSMTSYALREQAPALHAQLEASVHESQAARAAYDQIVSDLQRDLLAFRVQTASLRRENDVLAESVRTWRDEAVRYGNEARHAQQEVAGLKNEAVSLEQQMARHAAEEGRLMRENAALHAVLATWTRRKQRVISLIPRMLRPTAGRVYRRLVPRQTLSPGGRV